MDRQGLIAKFREDSADIEAPYLWSDAVVAGFLDEAQEEAAYRALLIEDASTAAVTQYAVSAGDKQVTLHSSVFQIIHAQFEVTGSDPVRLPIRSIQMLDAETPSWRTETGTPRGLVHTDTSVRFVCTPDVDGVLRLEVYRLPLEALADNTDTPEIARQHHRHLVNWALYRAFSKTDSETIDPNKASKAEAAFTAYFGVRPDANARRWHEAEDGIHAVVPSPL